MSRRTQLTRSVRSGTGTSVALAQPRAQDSEIVFSLSGLVTPTTSPPWVPRSDDVLVEVVALLGTPGSTSTSVAIRKNGVVVHVITLEASETRKVDSGLNILYADTADILTDTVTAVGTGAADLTILHRF